MHPLGAVSFTANHWEKMPAYLPPSGERMRVHVSRVSTLTKCTSKQCYLFPIYKTEQTVGYTLTRAMGRPNLDDTRTHTLPHMPQPNDASSSLPCHRRSNSCTRSATTGAASLWPMQRPIRPTTLRNCSSNSGAMARNTRGVITTNGYGVAWM